MKTDYNSLDAAMNGELIYKPDIDTHYSAASNERLRQLYLKLAAVVASITTSRANDLENEH